MSRKGWLVAPLLVLLSGCGWIKAGSGVAPNDPEPTGQIVASAPFTALSNVSVSGTVTIYDVSGGDYVIRLAGLVAPAESGLAIVPVVNGESVASIGLRTNTGTQNYTISSGVAFPRWEKVKLHSNPTNRDYAEALFDVN